MNKKRKVLLLSIVIIVIFFSGNSVTSDELAIEFKENQVNGVSTLIALTEDVEYFYSRGINDFDAGRITIPLAKDEKNDFQNMLSKIDFDSFESISEDEYYSIGVDSNSDLYTQDYYQYKLFHDNKTYSLEIRVTEKDTSIKVRYWPSGVTDMNELLKFSKYESLAILNGQLIDNSKELYQFRAFF